MIMIFTISVDKTMMWLLGFCFVIANPVEKIIIKHTLKPACWFHIKYKVNLIKSILSYDTHIWYLRKKDRLL